MRGRRGWTVAAVAGLLSGCGGGQADVAGTVTYLGHPLTAGSVTVVGPDGVGITSPIQPDGSYRVAGVPAGEVRIGVTTPRFAPAPAPKAAGGKAAAGKGARRSVPKGPDAPGKAAPAPAPPVPVIIPPTYADPQNSGLTADLSGGSNTHNIELN